jgi:hypothetical protein
MTLTGETKNVKFMLINCRKKKRVCWGSGHELNEECRSMMVGYDLSFSLEPSQPLSPMPMSVIAIVNISVKVIAVVFVLCFRSCITFSSLFYDEAYAKNC